MYTHTYHADGLIPLVDSVVIHHAYDGYSQVAAYAKRYAEAQTTQDGHNVASRQTKTSTVYHGLHLLLHPHSSITQLNPSIILLTLF